MLNLKSGMYLPVKLRFLQLVNFSLKLREALVGLNDSVERKHWHRPTLRLRITLHKLGPRQPYIGHVAGERLLPHRALLPGYLLRVPKWKPVQRTVTCY